MPYLITKISLAIVAISLLSLFEIDRPNVNPEFVQHKHKKVFDGLEGRSLMQFSRLSSGLSSADTTVIILNWSRLPNVILIVSNLCQNLLFGMIAKVVIWNNSPQLITTDTFAASGCPRGTLKIYNSPSNIFFEARFLACAQASTQFCFIQDDDYLIYPEIIRALRIRTEQPRLSGIHLSPPHEMLKSYLRTISNGENIHTSFAWLGYGTMIRRLQAVEFLSTMNSINVTTEEMKMADNYFTILSNTYPEMWFDHGVELGGGHPFTVGAEGNDRNDKHIIRAAQLLDRIVAHFSRISPYVSSEKNERKSTISRSPCLGVVCLFETSIKLLPEFDISAPHAENILEISRIKFKKLEKQMQMHYIDFPPSSAVDGHPNTAFRSYNYAHKDDWLSLDIFGSIAPGKNVVMELILLVDTDTEAILRASTFEASSDARNWSTAVSRNKPGLNCVGSPFHLEAQEPLRSCSLEFLISPEFAGSRVFRVYLNKDMEKKWCIYEMWVREKS